MPTPFSHAAVGYAIAAWNRPTPARRLTLVAVACAVLPDVDVLGLAAGVSPDSLLAHRGITHALLFAVAVAVLATRVFFSGSDWAGARRRVALVLALALVSHIALDSLTTYASGLAVFAPFTPQRFRFLWTPLGTASGAQRPVQEAAVVFLPALVVAWIGRKRAYLTGHAR